jgi:hypothetical protein
MYCRLPYVSRGGLSLKTLVLYIYRPRGTMQYNQQSYAIYSSDSGHCKSHVYPLCYHIECINLFHRMPIKICEDNNIHNIKYIRNNVKKKCTNFLRQNFGASLVFSISNHLTCRLSSAKCLELNIYTMLL